MALLTSPAQVALLVTYGIDEEQAKKMKRVDAIREIDCQNRKQFRAKSPIALAARKCKKAKKCEG